MTRRCYNSQIIICVALGWCRAKGGDTASLQGREKVARVSNRESENLYENFSLSLAGTGVGMRGEST